VSHTFVFDWRDMGSQTEVYLCEEDGKVAKLARDDPKVAGVRFTSLGEPLINIVGFERTKLVSLVAGSVQTDAVIDSLMGMNNFWQEYRYMADLSQSTATDGNGSPSPSSGVEGDGALRESVANGRCDHAYGDTNEDVIANKLRIAPPNNPPRFVIAGTKQKICPSCLVFLLAALPRIRILTTPAPGQKVSPALT
jgi:hypothetical protein